MVVQIVGTNQTHKEIAVATLLETYLRNGVETEIIHKPLGFLDEIHNGSVALFWVKARTLMREARKEEKVVIFDFSVLDYLWSAKKRGTATPEMVKSILQQIDPEDTLVFCDGTEERESLLAYLRKIGVPEMPEITLDSVIK